MEAGAYWSAITDKRRGRNAKRREHQPITLDDYVLTQPPVYTGPKRPVNPLPEPEQPHREHKYIPVVADLLKAAADNYQWAPEQPANDLDFKRAYARFASAAGLTREQAVRVYAIRDRWQRHACFAIGIPRLGTRSRPRSATTSF